MNARVLDDTRRMNISKNRTDVENLYLAEMVRADTAEILMEDFALDEIIDSGTDTGLFSDTSSEDILDDLTDDEDDSTGFLDGFDMVEL